MALGAEVKRGHKLKELSVYSASSACPVEWVFALYSTGVRDLLLSVSAWRDVALAKAGLCGSAAN